MKKIEAIKIDKIILDGYQPRKSINEAELKELAASINASGLIQPITVRKFKTNYIIVCGERRYQACKLLGHSSIDAIVVDVSAEQALEMQIIENLQRKDVHPLEECDAFIELMQNTTIENIAVLVGKSPKFVAQRLSLDNLVYYFKNMYLAGKITHKIAKQLSLIDTELQAEIFKEECEDWENTKDFILDDVDYYLRESKVNFITASFKLEDEELDPVAGACTNCKFNTGSQPLLFTEEVNYCTKPVCFIGKQFIIKKQEILKLAEDPELVFIVLTYGNPNAKDLKLIEFAIENGIEVHNRSLFYVRDKKEDFEYASFEEWIEDTHYDKNDEDYNEVEAMDEYILELQDFNEEKDLFEDDLKNGLVRKAVNVTLQESGDRFYYVELKGTKKNKDGKIELNPSQVEIDKIEAKEKRNKELDAEKVWANIRLLLFGENLEKVCTGEDMSQNEIDMIAHVLISKLSYGGKANLIALMCAPEDVYNIVFTKDWFNVLLKCFLIDAFVSAYGSHLNNGNNGKAYEFIKPYLPDEIKEIELAQEGVALARAERVAKKIELLKQNQA